DSLIGLYPTKPEAPSVKEKGLGSVVVCVDALDLEITATKKAIVLETLPGSFPELQAPETLPGSCPELKAKMHGIRAYILLQVFLPECFIGNEFNTTIIGLIVTFFPCTCDSPATLKPRYHKSDVIDYLKPIKVLYPTYGVLLT
ncbi:hypothetical protein MKW92_019855, partial [Papaver armeniacum]